MASADNLNPSEQFTDAFLEHYGVKGMKWGVRKKEDKEKSARFRERYRDLRATSARKALEGPLEAKTRNGETVQAVQVQPMRIAHVIGATSPKLTQQMKASDFVEFKVGGQKVGQGNLGMRNSEEMYLNWIGVDNKHRGKGYASAMFDLGIEHSKKQGAKRLVLEVPGNAPDARHIYEQRGFRQNGPMQGSKSDMWGGLTPMALDISETKIRHSEAEENDLELERAFEQHFDVLFQGIKPYDTPEEEVDNMSQGTEFTDAFLEHYGVKGMKWGVRKDRAERAAAAKGETLAFKRVTPDPSMKPRARRKAADNLEPSRETKEFVRVSSKVGTKGNTKALTNSELKMLNERMRLEQEFSRLSGEGQTSAGKKFVKDVSSQIARQQVSRVGNQVAANQIDTMIKNSRK